MPVSTEEIRQTIVSTLGPVESVLDVGCGDCSLVRFLAEEMACDARGIDLRSTGVHEEVHSAADHDTHLARCEEMNAQSMDAFTSECFDAVVSVHALHEIADPHAALREMRRVLKRGGRLLIADFTEGETRWNEDYFTTDQVATMLEGAGFRNVTVEPHPADPFMFAHARR